MSTNTKERRESLTRLEEKKLGEDKSKTEEFRILQIADYDFTVYSHFSEQGDSALHDMMVTYVLTKANSHNCKTNLSSTTVVPQTSCGQGAERRRR